MGKDFKGIWPAVFTPVDEDGKPALDQLEKLVELFITQNLDGLYLLGSTGQGVLFTEEERKKVTSVVCEAALGRIPVMVHVGALTTAESVRLARHAKDCGVDGISSVGPIYYSGSPDVTLTHYKAIAEATDLPFFPYQFGDVSASEKTISFIEELLKIPNLAGMKLTTNKLLEISSVHNYVGERLKLFSGCDELFCHASLCGTSGAIGTTYNIWGVECKQIMDEFKKGNYQLARKFMLTYQKQISLILSNGWTFFRKSMLLKYEIDIGPAKAPLGNTNTEWEDEDVLAVINEIESII